jgi:glyoxylase-like metal-dependent hydrolase (beta-lactamase superfamily II)
MREEVDPRRTKIWNTFFPGQIPNQLVIAEELEGNTIELEGNELRAVELGHTDWEDTTCLYVPSIRLAVAGDAAFNGTHMFLGASPTSQKRNEWISALKKIESLNPPGLHSNYMGDMISCTDHEFVYGPYVHSSFVLRGGILLHHRLILFGPFSPFLS